MRSEPVQFSYRVQNTHFAILGLLCIICYSNNYDHAFQLDDRYLILENHYIRSLKNIPEYFINPLTLTSFRTNSEYRPILQISYALNYLISGYQMWSWHLVQVLLHLSCGILLYLIFKHVYLLGNPSREKRTIFPPEFLASILFIIHPTAAGVVNYQSARSSLLTSVFVLTSLLMFMRYRHKEARLFYWAALVTYVMALFTKVEGVATLAGYFFYEMLYQTTHKDISSRNLLKDLFSTLNQSTFKRLFPFLLVTAFYAFVRQTVVADFIVQGRSSQDVSSWQYLITQVTAWWYYLFKWFFPWNLVADNSIYSVFHSIFHPLVIMAIVAWCGVAYLIYSRWSRWPALGFFALTSLAFISPHSSILPLAEMVNEHRPYLALGLLSMVWVQLISKGLSFWELRVAKPVIAGTFGFISIIFVFLTIQRNKVFKTEETYWGDILQKAPSLRAYNNYGTLLLRKGDDEAALYYFDKAQSINANAYAVNLNLGQIYNRRGQTQRALEHLNKAVLGEKYTGYALKARGDYYFWHRCYHKAMEDYEKSALVMRDTDEIKEQILTSRYLSQISRNPHQKHECSLAIPN